MTNESHTEKNSKTTYTEEGGAGKEKRREGKKKKEEEKRGNLEMIPDQRTVWKSRGDFHASSVPRKALYEHRGRTVSKEFGYIVQNSVSALFIVNT